MTKRSIPLLLYLVLAVCLQKGVAQEPITALPKMPASPLQEDVILLKKILEANHPSLYWYTPKDSIDWYFNYTINSITDSLNEVAFKNKLAWLISKIRCGHTVVRFSKDYGKVANSFRYPQFPLALKTWKDSLVVLGSIWPNDPVFKRGTVITGVNGRNNRQILDSIYQFISTDGYADNYKSQLISTNFPAWYKTVIGSDSVYTVSYIDTSGKEQTTTIHAYSPDKDSTLKKGKQSSAKKPSNRQLRELRLQEKRVMVIDTANSVAFIRLTTFSGGKLQRFFKRSFKAIRKLKLQNLVIDMRENGGGNVGNSIDLIQYITREPFKLGDSVVAISRRFRYGRYIHPAWPYWLVMNLVGKKTKDGLIHFRRYEQHYFQPKQKFHFDGNVYLVQGGLTFSAATMAIATLKGQQNVTVVGEETGGGYYGNSAMHIPVIKLPYSGLRVSLPMYRLVMDSARTRGHGIIPDLEIQPSSRAISQGIDLKIKTIRELIQQKNH